MTIISLAGLPEFGKLSTGAAEHWVAAAMAQARALREYDGFLYPADLAGQSAADRLHDAWRSWSQDTEVVLRQAEALPGAANAIPGLDELRDTIGRTRAMLQMTPALIARRRKQMEMGEVFTIDEVRSGLWTGGRR